MLVGLVSLLLVATGCWVLYGGGRRYLSPATVDERLAEYGPRVREKFASLSDAEWAALGNGELCVVVLKRERAVRLHWRAASTGAWRLLRTYTITAASGGPGPKLREGDRQVPEGVYAVESLHPNSRFHLALRVAYPSEADRAQARLDGRDHRTLGGDIMIHGGAGSIGCVAMGDEAIEEVFVLSAMVGVERVRLLMCPSGTPEKEITSKTPAWVADRYRELARRLVELEG